MTAYLLIKADVEDLAHQIREQARNYLTESSEAQWADGAPDYDDLVEQHIENMAGISYAQAKKLFEDFAEYLANLP